MKKSTKKNVVAHAPSPVLMHANVAPGALPPPRPCPFTGAMQYPVRRGDGRIVWTGVPNPLIPQPRVKS